MLMPHQQKAGQNHNTTAINILPETMEVQTFTNDTTKSKEHA
jgi:hypothetical protein